MTRPKVPDDKRQRTAQACDSCKRRKQKVGSCVLFFFIFNYLTSVLGLSLGFTLLCAFSPVDGWLSLSCSGVRERKRSVCGRSASVQV